MKVTQGTSPKNERVTTVNTEATRRMKRITLLSLWLEQHDQIALV